MKKSFLLILFVAIVCSISAQHKGVLKVLEGKIIEGQFFVDKLHILDEFKDGRVTLNNGETYAGKLNINTLDQSLRILNDKGDTIRIDSEKEVSVVSVGRDFFKKINNQYAQLINTDGEVSLALVRKMVIGAEKLQGAYGGTSTVQAISKLAALEDDSRFDKITGTINLEYFYDELLFLIDKNGRMQLATKKNFERLFPKKKKLISQYLSETDVKFHRKEDLMAFFTYLISN
jgi:hypothetical protein